MQRNLLILRASPDWNTFDLERSRGFLKSLHLPEDLVIAFAALWGRHFKVDYRGVRAQLKTLALQTYGEVRQASLLRHEEWDGNGPARRPGCLRRRRRLDVSQSVRKPAGDDVGGGWRALGFAAARPRFRAERLCRAADPAASPRSHRLHQQLRRDRASACPPWTEQRCSNTTPLKNRSIEPDFTLVTSEKYLSCAVKHPCCTMSANHLMSLDDFRSDPRREMSEFMESVDAVPLDGIEEWLRKPFAQFRQVMTDAVRPR